jgi:hypothetical protein
MAVDKRTLLKSLISFLLLALFAWGVGKPALFPSLRLFHDTPWDASLFFPLWGAKALVLLWMIPIGFGFLGWTRVFKEYFPKTLNPEAGRLMGASLSLCAFAFYVFGLGINEILNGPLVLLFFISTAALGLREWKEIAGDFPEWRWKPTWPGILFAIPLALWGFEFFSPPIIWDAVLDHFRYAREVSRLHQIPFHWTNHTGDMPKFAEMVFAGFWTLGGEGLSKLSAALPALLAWRALSWFLKEWKTGRETSGWIFWTCPFFLAVFSWGYVEGFLALFVILTLVCYWKSLQEPENGIWAPFSFFFLGTSFSVKPTAVLAAAALGLVFLFDKALKKTTPKLNAWCLVLFCFPSFPWLLKNALAFGNPFYPLAVPVFGSVGGYPAGMEKALLLDTGWPQTLSWAGIVKTLWKNFFTSDSSVRAAWTPLAVMASPWVWKLRKDRLFQLLFLFFVFYLFVWLLSCTGLRHAAGAAAGLTLLGAMGWKEALSGKGVWPKAAFGAGIFLSLWLCLSAQWTSTFPYASALGLEEPLQRLTRNYSFGPDVYKAYRDIERDSGPRNKVLAFAVFQTYPLQRASYVDFFWRKPVFLEWASACGTAEQLADVLRRKGVTHFLYQRREAEAMSRGGKGFILEGMPEPEYVRFWRYYMDTIAEYDNVFVYRVRENPRAFPLNPSRIPGIQDKAGAGIEGS